MDVLVNVEHRFRRTPDGAVWTQTQFPFAFWQRYLDVFSRVRIVARAEPVAEAPTDWTRVDGERVEFHSLPHYHGLKQYLLRRAAVQRSITEAIGPRHAVILRVHSPIGLWIEKRIKREHRPFAVEVVADPWDLFSPGATRHPLRPLLRRYFAATLRRQCQQASASSYVTQFALQQRYPNHPDRFTTHYSSIELGQESFRGAPHTIAPSKRVKLITVGALDQMYKGVDVLIDAVARCRQSGIDLDLTVVGDGRHFGSLKRLTLEVGLGDRVVFLGNVPAGQAVREQLDASDLFVLASRQEGLPRSMIEAMARGLSCIGTSVGGIPELLPDEDRVPVNDPVALAAKIREVVTNPKRMNLMASRNWQKATEYEESQLRARRCQLYTALRDATYRWHSGDGTEGERVVNDSLDQPTQNLPVV